MNLFKFVLALVLGIELYVGSVQVKETFYNGPLKIAMHSGIGGRSHIKGALEMGHMLAGRGHSVEYVAMEDCLRFAKGYNISTFKLGPQFFIQEQLREQLIGDLTSSKRQKIDLMSPRVIKVMKESYIRTFELLKTYLEEKKPDLWVCDFTIAACNDLAKITGIPLIIYVQTTDIFGLISAPYITKYMEYGPLTIENMRSKERIMSSIVEPLSGVYKIIPFFKFKSEMRDKYKVPKSNAIFSGFDYGVGISNTFTGFEPAAPIQPNIIQVGPILSPSLDKLNVELNQFLSVHTKTIFIAFGSNVKLPTKDIAKLITAGIMSLKTGVVDGLIWGLGETTVQDFPEVIEVNGSIIKVKGLFDGKFEGIKFLRWAPQQAILNHSSTKLFVSHGGLESLLEGIYSATPILCIPYFGDQPRNAAKLESLGTGFYVDRSDSSSSSIADSINRIIRDESGLIQTNLNRMKVISSYNFKRINMAADIIEGHAYTAKACRLGLPYDSNNNFPPCETRHLITPDTRMGWIKSNLIDIYLTAIFIGLSITGLTLYLFTKIVLTVCKLVNKSVSFQEKTKKN